MADRYLHMGADEDIVFIDDTLSYTSDGASIGSFRTDLRPP